MLKNPGCPGFFMRGAQVVVRQVLDNALRQHGVSHFDEPGDVGATNVVSLLSLTAVFNTGVVNVEHDVMQTRVDFLGFPAHARGVLRHFEA